MIKLASLQILVTDLSRAATFHETAFGPTKLAKIFQNEDGSRSLECRDPDSNALKIMALS